MEHVLSGQNSRKAHVLRRRLVPCAAAFALPPLRRGPSPRHGTSNLGRLERRASRPRTRRSRPRPGLPARQDQRLPVRRRVLHNVTGDPIHLTDHAARTPQRKVNIDGSRRSRSRRDLNGVQIRRIYFQLDNDLSIQYSTRLRLEADSKRAHLGRQDRRAASRPLTSRRARCYPRGDVFAGHAHHADVGDVEELWGYRSIEKTIADFRGLGLVGRPRGRGQGLRRSPITTSATPRWSATASASGRGQPLQARLRRACRSTSATLWVEAVRRLRERRALVRPARPTSCSVGYESQHSVVGLEIVDRVQASPRRQHRSRAGASVFARWSRDPQFGAFARFDFWQTRSARFEPRRLSSSGSRASTGSRSRTCT